MKALNITEDQSLGGWSRVMSTAGQAVLLLAVTFGSPESAPDLSDVAAQGEGIIKSGFALYAQITLLCTTLVTAYSKIVSILKNKG